MGDVRSFLNERVTLHCGDCLGVLPTLAENSVDACVTDPPYHLTSIVKRFSNGEPAHTKTAKDIAARSTPIARLAGGFMNQKWDGGDIAFQPETWAEVWRVLKPGGHLLAFAAPRNAHRMVCAIEDAGFEIRDGIQWIFGSGFPKSHDVSKGIDRTLEAEREVVHVVARTGKEAGTYGAFVGPSPITAPATDAARQWEGWGTSTKPAYEPICLARKPLSEGTVAANVLRWGTGALNIDGCRVGIDDVAAPERLQRQQSNRVTWEGGEASGFKADHVQPLYSAKGRWPANIILSWPEDEYQLRRDVTPEQKRELYGWLSENA